MFKMFKISFFILLFINLTQSSLVLIFNHLLTIDYSAYKIAPKTFEMLNLEDQKLYHLRENLRLLNTYLVVLFIILFSLAHIFLIFILKKEKLSSYLSLCLIFTLLSFTSYLIDNETFLWYLIIFLCFIVFCLYFFILDKIFRTHCFKIYLLFLILFNTFEALEFNFTQFIKPFVLPIYLILLFVFTRKKSIFLNENNICKA